MDLLIALRYASLREQRSKLWKGRFGYAYVPSLRASGHA